MSNTYQAKSGFKSFVLTLSLSLVIFSALYYVVTDMSKEVDIEKEEEQNKVTVNTEDSIFKRLSEQTSNNREGTVLAGAETAGGTPSTLDTAEETTESTVPDTGSNTFMGIATGFILLTAALYMIINGPRKLALSEFEKDVLKDL